MSGQPLTVGRLVHYRLTDQDVNDVFLAVGSRATVRAGDVRPAMVVMVDQNDRQRANLQVFIGPCTVYRTSVSQRPPNEDGLGQWSWPPRV